MIDIGLPGGFWDGMGGSLIAAAVTILGIFLAYQFGRRQEREILAHQEERRAAEQFTEELQRLENLLTSPETTLVEDYFSLTEGLRQYDQVRDRIIPSIRTVLIRESMYLPSIALGTLLDQWVPRAARDNPTILYQSITKGSGNWRSKMNDCRDTTVGVRLMLAQWRSGDRIGFLPYLPAFVDDPRMSGPKHWDFTGEVDEAIRWEWLKYDKRMKRREFVHRWTRHPYFSAREVYWRWKSKFLNWQAKREERAQARVSDTKDEFNPGGDR